MPELLDAVHDLLEHPPAPAAPLDVIRRRARTLRRQRLARWWAIIPVAAAVVAVSVTLVSPAAHNQHVIAGPATTSVTQPAGGLAPVPLRMIPGPAGWQPVDFGHARVWVPSDWTVLPTGMNQCQNLFKVVLVDPSASSCNPPVLPVSVVTLRPAPSVGDTGPARTVNGYRVLVPSVGPTFVIPELSVSITIVTTSEDERQAILSTLGPSSRAAVLAPGQVGPPPRDWKAVTYGQTEIRVPASWSVANIDASATFDVCRRIFRQPSVVLDSPALMPPCPAGIVRPPGDGVWLLRLPGPPEEPAGVLTSFTTSTGLLVEVFNSNDGFSMVINAYPVQVVLGLGTDPAIARTILYSMSALPAAAAPSPTTPSTAAGCEPTQLSLTYEGSSAATGAVLGSFAVRNTSAAACVVEGYPKIRAKIGSYLLDLPTSQGITTSGFPGYGQTAQPVQISPGGTARFFLLWNEIPRALRHALGVGRDPTGRVERLRGPCTAATTRRVHRPGTTLSNAAIPVLTS